jgi:Sigma-70, region 4
MRRLGRRTPRSAVTGSPGFLTVGRAMPSAPPIHVGGLRANGREPGRYALTLVTLDGHEDDGPGPLVERLADSTATPEDLAVLAIDATRAQAHLARLGPREQVVLQLLFGLDGIEALDHRRAASIVGVSAATVRRVRDRALGQLARALTAPRVSSSSISMPFGEVSACPTCWPPDSCSSST